MVLRPEKEEQAKQIFTKWGLDFAVVGVTTDDLRFSIHHQGEEVANLPIKKLGDEAPEYDRPWIEPGTHSPQEPHLFAPPHDYNAALIKLLGSPDLSSRRWVWEQYDTWIQGNSLQLPGGDAGVVRVEGHDTKALAFSSDVTPRYVEADPYQGGKQAVAECYRNLIATGAEPLAATDNLNFGNPEKPEIMGQLVAAVRGIGEACEALSMPIVSGNVSLYNETNGEAILPTPTIGGVGLIEDHARMARIDTADTGDVVFLIGTEATHLANSLYQREILFEESGPAPEVDLLMERARGDFVLAAIRSEYASACHDISDGGLAIALAEMCMASGEGMRCEIEVTYPHSALFGEDQARYLVAVDEQWADMFAANCEGSGVSFAKIGTVGGDRLIINDLIDISVEDMTTTHESWFPAFMGETALAAAAE